MTITYRFFIESPTVGGDYEEDVEFDEEPTQQVLMECLDTIYSNYFPGSWERLEEES